MATEPGTKPGSLHGESLKPQPFQPGKHTQVDSCGHVVQGLTDGYVVVIGHANQQDHLGSSKEVFSKDLSHAATEGYGVLSRDQVKDQLGCYGERVETVYHGQIGEKIVHGRTEGWTGEDGD